MLENRARSEQQYYNRDHFTAAHCYCRMDFICICIIAIFFQKNISTCTGKEISNAVPTEHISTTQPITSLPKNGQIQQMTMVNPTHMDGVYARMNIFKKLTEAFLLLPYQIKRRLDVAKIHSYR